VEYNEIPEEALVGKGNVTHTVGYNISKKFATPEW